MTAEKRQSRIFSALDAHHAIVAEDYDAAMTVLIGSQNYDLDMENSDYDTFTFVVPSLKDIAQLKEPVSTTVDGPFGHINIKDIRLALNQLKKTNPNIVECFSFKYALVSGVYQAELSGLKNPFVLRCNTQHMMNAIGGMAQQLSKRNMPPGKRFSHILRMRCMIRNYFDVGSDLLSLQEEERTLALQAKLDKDNPKWEKMIEACAADIKEEISKADLWYFDDRSDMAKELIDNIQYKLLLKKYCEKEGRLAAPLLRVQTSPRPGNI